jgi:transposase
MPMMPRLSAKQWVRPNMRFVGINSEEQQAVLMMHRVETLVVANRTALVNQSARPAR